MSETFENAMLELNGDVRVGSWRWLSYWRRTQRQQQEFLEAFLGGALPQEEAGNK